jgi:hypothetical protein
MAWLQQQSTRERPDTFTQLSSSSHPRTLHGRGGPYIFCEYVLQCRVVEHGVRLQLLQPGVLALQPLQALGLGDLEPALLGLPVVEARLADPVLAAHVGRLHPGLVLLQNRNDLRMPLSLHRLVPSQSQTPVHPGSIQWGNVTAIGLSA